MLFETEMQYSRRALFLEYMYMHIYIISFLKGLFANSEIKQISVMSPSKRFVFFSCMLGVVDRAWGCFLRIQFTCCLH